MNSRIRAAKFVEMRRLLDHYREYNTCVYIYIFFSISPRKKKEEGEKYFPLKTLLPVSLLRCFNNAPNISRRIVIFFFSRSLAKHFGILQSSHVLLVCPRASFSFGKVEFQYPRDNVLPRVRELESGLKKKRHNSEREQPRESSH